MSLFRKPRVGRSPEQDAMGPLLRQLREVVDAARNSQKEAEEIVEREEQAVEDGD